MRFFLYLVSLSVGGLGIAASGIALLELAAARLGNPYLELTDASWQQGTLLAGSLILVHVTLIGMMLSDQEARNLKSDEERGGESRPGAAVPTTDGSVGEVRERAEV